MPLSLKDPEVNNDLKDVELTKQEEFPSSVLGFEVEEAEANSNKNTLDEERADTKIAIKYRGDVLRRILSFKVNNESIIEIQG